MTESATRVLAERADRCPGSRTRTRAPRWTWPSGRSPVAAQQPAGPPSRSSATRRRPGGARGDLFAAESGRRAVRRAMSSVQRAPGQERPGAEPARGGPSSGSGVGGSSVPPRSVQCSVQRPWSQPGTAWHDLARPPLAMLPQAPACGTPGHNVTSPRHDPAQPPHTLRVLQGLPHRPPRMASKPRFRGHSHLAGGQCAMQCATGSTTRGHDPARRGTTWHEGAGARLQDTGARQAGLLRLGALAAR